MRRCEFPNRGWVGQGVRLTAAVLLMFGAILPGPTACAASPAEAKSPPASAAEITVKSVEGRMKRLAAARDVDEAAKQASLGFYKQALADLQEAGTWAAKVDAFEREAKEAPARLKAIRAELTKPPPEAKPTVPGNASLVQVQQLLAQSQADLAGARKELNDLETKQKHRAASRKDINKRMVALRAKLDETGDKLRGKPDPKDPASLADARRVALLAAQRSLQQRIAALGKELLSYVATAELLTEQRDQAVRRVSQQKKQVKAWQQVVNERRREEALRAAQQAKVVRRAAADAHPLVRKLAKQNAELAERRTGEGGVAAKIEKAAKDHDAVKKALASLGEDFTRVKEKERAAGLTAAIGVLLRKKRAELPDAQVHRRHLRLRRSEISNVQLMLIDYEAARKTLADVEAQAQKELSGVGLPDDPLEKDAIEQSVRQLLRAKREYLDALFNDYDSYFTKLVDLDTDEQQLVLQVTAYATYFDERILWIRSTTLLRPHDLAKLLRACRWFASPTGWAGVLKTVWGDIRRKPLRFAMGILVVLLLLLTKHRLHAGLEAMAKRVKRAQTDRFAYTLVAGALTALVALPWPLLLWWLGWRVATYAEAPEFAKAVAVGLRTSALLYFALGLLAAFCRPRGIAEAHFRWNAEGLRLVRLNLKWLVLVLTPAVFVSSMVQAQPNEGWQDTLGRLAFMAALVAVSVFVQIVFRPTGTVIQSVLARHRDGWLDRLRYVWYPILFLAPLALAVLAGLGYVYTAQQLTKRLVTMFLFIGMVGLVHGLLLRLLFVARRRLAIQRAEERRAAEAEGEERPEAHPGEAGAASAQGPKESLYAMGVQTRRLLQSLVVIVLVIGLWRIWADVLPALGILKQISPWSSTLKVSETIAGPDGSPLVRMVEKRVAVTLADLGLAVLVVMMTIIAVKNIPGVLEITILQRLPLEPGVRFAIAALSRYTITVVGFVFAFGVIGIGWAKVQWLAAAVTVGLGFGLQEIFANFVSGLIILFERPMRVGDTVTVGDTTGTVTRIRIRATTITDWDRKELIVPNREFITGRLVNWTLSDTIVRMVFPVGIAYGSDIALAEKTLLEVARDNFVVLEEPVPFVIFRGFGDSSLNFELRVYIPSMESYFKVWHRINAAIDTRFRQADIVIAFPQQDLHVRSIEQALPIIDHLNRRGAAEKGRT